MSDSLWDWGMVDFRERTAAGDPTPGGGSVAAVAATFGIGLVIMALEVTRKRAADDPDRLLTIDGLLAEARDVMELLADRADQDVAAFDGFMAALRLPRNSDEDKAARRTALAAAAVAATEAPLDAAADAVAGLRLAMGAAELAGLNIISDVAAGAHLLAAGATAVLLNVDINLPSIKDEAAASEYAARRRDLAEAAATLSTQVQALITTRLAE